MSESLINAVKSRLLIDRDDRQLLGILLLAVAIAVCVAWSGIDPGPQPHQ